MRGVGQKLVVRWSAGDLAIVCARQRDVPTRKYSSVTRRQDETPNELMIEQAESRSNTCDSCDFENAYLAHAVTLVAQGCARAAMSPARAGSLGRNKRDLHWQAPELTDLSAHQRAHRFTQSSTRACNGNIELRSKCKRPMLKKC